MEEQQGENYSELAICLKAVIDSAIDGIITVDDKGIIESINPAGANLFGYVPSEIIGTNISLLMPSDHAQKHDSYIDRYDQTGEATILGKGREVEGRKKEGSLFPIRLAVSQVQLKERKLFMGTVHDLSAIKTAETKIKTLNEALEQTVKVRTEELRATINKLQSTNQQLADEIKERQQVEAALRISLEKEKELGALKSRFISTASHEFRTPLSSILSSVELIGEYEKEAQKKQRQRHIARIKSAVELLVEILNDFLSLSKLQEGKISAHPAFFSLQDFFEEILLDMESLLKDGQQIKVEGQPLTTVFLDRKLLKKILINLLSNAIKYSEAGQAIRCNSELIDQVLTIEVVDKGIGIPAIDQKYLFSRFFRAHNAENYQGTGLGLNIVKKYLKLMNGTISFESKEGVGTSFRISIPLKKPLS